MEEFSRQSASAPQSDALRRKRASTLHGRACARKLGWPFTEWSSEHLRFLGSALCARNPRGASTPAFLRRSCRTKRSDPLEEEGYLHCQKPWGLPFYGRFTCAKAHLRCGRAAGLGAKLAIFTQKPCSADVVTQGVDCPELEQPGSGWQGLRTTWGLIPPPPPAPAPQGTLQNLQNQCYGREVHPSACCTTARRRGLS